MRARTWIAAGALALAIGAGVVYFRSKPALPEYGPTVVIVVSHPASIETLEHTIVEPIEQAVNGLARLENLRTEAEAGGVRIACRFAKGTAVDDAAERTQNAVHGALKQLPREVSPPIVEHASFSKTLFFAHDKPIEEIERIPSVGEVWTCGERKERIHVVLDFEHAKARSVDIADVFAAFSARPGTARESDPETIEATRVGNSGAVLRDIARVERRLEEPACIGVVAGKPGHRVARIKLRTETEQQTRKAVIAIGGELRKNSALFFDAESTVRIALGLPPAKVERRAAAEKVAAALQKTKGVEIAGVFGASSGDDAEAIVVPMPGVSAADIDGLRAAVRSVPDVTDRGLLASPHGVPPRAVVIANDEATAREADKAVAASGKNVLVRDLPAARPTVDLEIDRPRVTHAGLATDEVARTARMIIDGVDMPLFHFATEPAGMPGIEAANLHGHPLAPLVKLTNRTETKLVRVNRQRVFERVWEVESTSQRDTIQKALGDRAKVELLPAP